MVNALPGHQARCAQCTWAEWIDQRSGNGEIKVSGQGITFAAPVLIVHYIEQHRYLPPAQFLEAVERANLWPAEDESQPLQSIGRGSEVGRQAVGAAHPGETSRQATNRKLVQPKAEDSIPGR